MSEEEIIKEIELDIKITTEQIKKGDLFMIEKQEKQRINAMQGLLDLYNKEKEKNIELQTKLELEKIDNKYNKEETSEEMIPKYVIRNKIKELEEDKKGYEEEGFENMKFATEITIIALEELLEENEE